MVSNIEKSAALLSNYQDQVATLATRKYRLLLTTTAACRANGHQLRGFKEVRVRVRTFREAEGIQAIFSWLTD